ncbi:methyl-accepting chemotaxis protein [Desulfosporosinus sp.]|uniref:methyl-accepting chemotaxis protein n=1 Tax=Desulfosporosinus sp. TaxID=157907 RepID=UPI0025C1DFB4|nr:methyl-accepting chemotaxis protein [Desulfosporosinus sp.]MBC2721375.1 methyl-accepting chemotaxis protein [Desulfosporosinus sp.]MBC2728106.1 methyl-accepting chemotaxis protein [Desulfosporosinus sp.]
MSKNVSIGFTQKKHGLETITRIAKEFEGILAQFKDLESARKPIREAIDLNLQNHEYLLLCDLKGLAVVHSNRLREGMYFNNEIELRAAQCSEPITQIYHRNTGEVLLDAASPVFVHGEHTYAVRLGIPLHKVRLTKQVFTGVLPTLFLGGTWIGLSSFSTVSMLSSMLALGAQIFYSVWLKNKLATSLQETFKVTKAIAKGNLTVLAKAPSDDELGNLSYEVNKVSLGMKSIIMDLASFSERAQNMSQTQASHAHVSAENQETLAATLEEFSAGATDQIQGMKASQKQVDEIQSASQSILSSTQEVLSLATSAKTTSQEGTRAINEAIREMGIIYQVTEQANQSILNLAEQAQKIGDIISVITGISEQTNLLALNAAIEAARAGEHGRGFAVVAEEVRKLADGSANSSRQIMELITGVQTMVDATVSNISQGMGEVNRGKDVIEKAGQAITSLDEVINATSSKVEANLQNADSLLIQSQLLAETQRQATTIAVQFAEGATQAATTVEQQMVSTQEIATISSELAKTSAHLHKVIRRFEW